MLKGRCWGINKEGNPYRSSNITIAVDNELISISQALDGTLVIHEFVKGKDTLLGKKAKEILKEEGLCFKE